MTVPGKHLDQLWRAYEDFEKSSSINPQLARKELEEQRPRYDAAKKATPEKSRLTRDLDAYAWAVPPGLLPYMLVRSTDPEMEFHHGLYHAPGGGGGVGAPSFVLRT